MGFIINGINSRWQRGRVPFEIKESDFPSGSPNRLAVDSAINYWNIHSGLQLVPHNGEADFAIFQVAAAACQSPVGRQGGSQSISCAVGAGFGVGSLMHEIGHCFGLIHEHQRPDRNNFVAVTGTGKNFDVQSNALPIGPYDCGSLMHYPNGAQIANRGPACTNMGQRLRQSDGDLAALWFGHPITDVDILGDKSDVRLALTSHLGRLYLAWRGSGNDNLNIAFSDDSGITIRGKQTLGETSSHAPALTSHNGKLYLAWKGSGNANINVAQVNISSPDNPSINGLVNKKTLGETTDNSPALTSHTGFLFMGWRGSGNDNLNVSLSADDGSTFAGRAISDTSSDSPALVSHNGRLVMAWKGSGNDNINLANVELAGSLVTGNLLGKTTISDTTSASPNIASCRGTLFLCWRGSGNENLTVYASDDGGATFRDKRISGETSPDSPVLTLHTGSLLVGWRGSGNNNISVGRVSLKTDIVFQPVAVVSSIDRGTQLFALGGDNRVWTAFFDPQNPNPNPANAGWSPWFPLGQNTFPRGSTAWLAEAPNTFAGGSVISAVSSTPRGTQIFVLGTDSRVWTTFFDPQNPGPMSGGWANWFPLGGNTFPARSPITAITSTPRGTQIFVLGDDGKVWTAFFDPQNLGPMSGGWSNWFPLGTNTFPAGSIVGAVSSTPRGSQIFVVGGDGGVWTTFFDPQNPGPMSGGWSNWFRLGSNTFPLDSIISVVSSTPHGTQILLLGFDGKVWTTFFDPQNLGPMSGGWANWFPLGANTFPPESSVRAISSTPRGTQLFVLGSDGQVWTIFFDPLNLGPVSGGWSNWFPLNTAPTAGSPLPNLFPAGSGIGAVSSTPRGSQVFVLGGDGQVWTAFFDPLNLGPMSGGWSQWFPVP
jgi:Astacin (Peptidase family M12A)